MIISCAVVFFPAINNINNKITPIKIGRAINIVNFCAEVPLVTLKKYQVIYVKRAMTPKQIAEAQRLAAKWKPKTWEAIRKELKIGLPE